MTLTNLRKRLREIAELWVSAKYQPDVSDVPDVLYHYTDAAALAGTLRSGRLWLTDSRFLNDREELKYSLDRARELIRSKQLGCTDDVLNALYSDILDFGEMESNRAFLVYSLSTESDDLSQWRGYANDGLGFTIGFSGPELARLAKGAFGFTRVEYNSDVQIAAIESALAQVKECFLIALAGGKIKIEAAADAAAREFDEILEGRAAINKHHSFSAEREWRIVGEAANDDKEIKARVSGDRIIPYAELQMGGKDKLPIVEIGVGPAFAGDEVIVGIRALCRETEYSPKIYFAETPYRQT